MRPMKELLVPGIHMDEYREITYSGPVVLARGDLAELESVLLEGLSPHPGDLKIQVLDQARTIKAGSIEQLLAKTLRQSTRCLSMEVISWNEKNDIDAGVSLNLHKNFVQYQLHALSEAQFLGKKAQLDRFLQRHRPWYAPIIKVLPFVAPSLFFPALFASALLVRDGHLLPASLAVTLCGVTTVVSWLGLTGKIFPFVWVHLTETPTRRPSWELAAFILNLLILIATIVSIIVPLTGRSSE
jgi:hypothetical protein